MSVPSRAPLPRPLAAVAASAALSLIVAACGGSATTPAPTGPAPAPTGAASAAPTASPALEDTLVVYSGRNEELVGPVIEAFETATGVRVDVRYAGTSELAATILEEGDNSPADVFFSQDAGALGALATEDRLARLPADLLDLVDARFRSPDGVWTGVTGRARVLAYDTRELSAADLPDSVLDLTDPAWRGRVGWVPTNASFQTFVTALRLQLGDEAAKAWLVAMKANEPRAYEGNSAALRAIAAGEIDVALINHYYLYAAKAGDPSIPVANHFFTGGDPGALVNIAGVGVLSTARHPVAAEAFVRHLLSSEGQTYFATKTFEYALVDGIPPAAGLPALAEIESPDLDLTDLADLAGTIRLLQEAGVL